MDKIVYFENEFNDVDCPRIGFENRGLLYGETIFTTLKTVNGKHLFLDDHIERLKLGALFLWETELPIFEIKKGLESCLEKFGHDIYSRITLFWESSSDFQISRNGKLNFFIIAGEIPDISMNPISISCGKRQKRQLPSYIKCGNYLDSLIELRKAGQRGFTDVLFLSENEMVMECSTSNIFFRKGKLICTPRLNSSILDGVTRKRLIDCLLKNGFSVKEDDFYYDDLKDADQVWVTSSVRGVRPVGRIEEIDYLAKPREDSILDKINQMFSSYQTLS